MRRIGVVVLIIISMVCLLKGIFDVSYYSVLEEQRMSLKNTGERVDNKIDQSQMMFQMVVSGQNFFTMSDERLAYKCKEILSYGFSSVRIFDSSAQLVYKVDNTDTNITTFIKQSDYAKMMDGKFIMRGKVDEADKADSAVIMMLPILSDNMEYSGAAAAYIKGDDFSKLLEKDNDSSDSYFVITDEEDFFIYSDQKKIAEDSHKLYENSQKDDSVIRKPNNFLKKLFDADTKEIYLDIPIVNAPWHVIKVMTISGVLGIIIIEMLHWLGYLVFIAIIVWIIVWQISQQREISQTKSHIEMEKMRMMMRMSASMAHEIKNPLTSLKGFIQYLYYKQKKEHPEQEKFFTIMFDEIDRIEMLANQFCMLAKPEENIKKAVIEMNEVLEQIYLLIDAQAKKRGIELVYQPFKAKVSIWGNHQQLKQIFINLLNNACDAVQDNGKVQIVCEEAGRECRISIVDNGVGIKAEDLSKLCTAFYTTKEQGNGLGLMITNELIKQHQGKMTVQSEFGKGTVFIVAFPLYNINETSK